MKKIICIGECSLNIVFNAAGLPVGAMPGGRVVNAAALLAKAGLPVVMASEASSDGVGTMVVDFLEKAGVATASIDRFTEGRTPLNVFTLGPDGRPQLTRYEKYPPEEGFDIIWPRVEEGDIVIFGGYYAIDPRNHNRMMRFLENAREMKALLIYLPGFIPGQEPRITRVMPALLENLELADMVLTRSDDLSMIFGLDGAQCYARNIGFYCRSMVNVDADARVITYFTDKASSELPIESNLCRSLIWNAGILAGVVRALEDIPGGAPALDAPDSTLRGKVLTSAVREADSAAEAIAAPWQECE
ncbi:MAG: hypothetical protein K2M06_04595 [Muribaculaceae bacterium]|nr:hypothetical protein [Muribaculaceae bacterium]